MPSLEFQVYSFQEMHRHTITVIPSSSQYNTVNVYIHTYIHTYTDEQNNYTKQNMT